MNKQKTLSKSDVIAILEQVVALAQPAKDKKTQEREKWKIVYPEPVINSDGMKIHYTWKDGFDYSAVREKACDIYDTEIKKVSKKIKKLFSELGYYGRPCTSAGDWYVQFFSRDKVYFIPRKSYYGNDSWELTDKDNLVVLGRTASIDSYVYRDDTIDEKLQNNARVLYDLACQYCVSGFSIAQSLAYN